MAKINRNRKRVRGLTINNSRMDYSTLFLSNIDGSFPMINLSDRPEIELCVNKIADLVSNMTIKLMENSEFGNVELTNELAKKVDTSPYQTMIRKNFIFWIVKTALKKGNAFVLPIFTIKDGKEYLEDLKPLINATIISDGFDFVVAAEGKQYSKEELLIFTFNPKVSNPLIGDAYQAKELITNLAKAANTKSEFMSGRYNPSLIIKVDSNTAALSSDEGRQKIYDSYIGKNSAGKPWVIPAEMLEVEQVKPLTLNDIALNESVEIDMKMLAGIYGIPAFIFGIGSFNKEEFNNFISTTILGRAKVIEQVLTKGLLFSDKLFFKFNPASLYSYDLQEIYSVYGDAFTKGLVKGNEVRNKLGLSPIDKLEELIILENYINLNDISKQKKLDKGEENE